MGKSIQEELQQNKFRNNQQMVQLNILFTAGYIQNKHLKILKNYGLSHQQYNVLRILKGKYPEAISLGHIKSRMLDRMSDTSRVVNRLFLAGLLKRETDKYDRRTMKIVISAKGIKLLKEMEKEEDVLDHVTMKLSDDEASMLSGLLDKIRENS